MCGAYKDVVHDIRNKAASDMKVTALVVLRSPQTFGNDKIISRESCECATK